MVADRTTPRNANRIALTPAAHRQHRGRAGRADPGGRGTDRVNVRFDTETKVASVRPHLLRVTSAPAPAGGGR